MKLLIAVIVLVILGGGVWSLQKDKRSTTGDDSQRVGAESGDLKVDALSSDAPAVVQNSESQGTQVVEVAEDPTVPDDTSEGAGQSAPATPFTTIIQTETDAEPQFAEPDTSIAESMDNNVDTTSANMDGQDNTDSKNIVVPQSYPVTDAAKYFIPKEQRGPGRLGGPPPLDFPGGPSDPDSADADPFAPPPAPGN